MSLRHEDARRRNWVAHALQRIEADSRRSADNHLIPLALPEVPGVTLYLKDEPTHPSGSLKHRLAREMSAHGQVGSIATLICDAGERYHDSLFAPGWIAAQGLDASASVQDSDAA